MAVKKELVGVQINISYKKCTFLVIQLHLTGVQSNKVLKNSMWRMKALAYAWLPYRLSDALSCIKIAKRVERIIMNGEMESSLKWLWPIWMQRSTISWLKGRDGSVGIATR